MYQRRENQEMREEQEMKKCIGGKRMSKGLDREQNKTETKMCESRKEKDNRLIGKRTDVKKYERLKRTNETEVRRRKK